MSRVAFKSQCPACGGSLLCNWQHDECGYHETVDEYGSVYCNKCDYLGKIWELRYQCSGHSDFRECTRSQEKFKNALKMLLTEIATIPDGGLDFSINLLLSARNSGYFTEK